MPKGVRDVELFGHAQALCRKRFFVCYTFSSLAGTETTPARQEYVRKD